MQDQDHRIYQSSDTSETQSDDDWADVEMSDLTEQQLAALDELEREAFDGAGHESTSATLVSVYFLVISH